MLPASDYPDPVGYISPGVILLVNDMDEVVHNNKSFVPTDVTVSVTCKPKKIYPRSTTNWANDMVAVRLLFREEHEVTMNEGGELSDFPEHVIPYVIHLRDTLMQFELMTIPGDYTRVSEGGDHVTREKLSISVLHQRIATITDALKPVADCADVNDCPSQQHQRAGRTAKHNWLVNLTLPRGDVCSINLNSFKKKIKLNFFQTNSFA